MAGYSGTPLAKQLGIKAGARVLAVDAPAELAAWLAPLPAGVALLTAEDGAAELDVVLLFATEARALETHFAPLARRLRPAGGLWAAWPKQTARVPTDLDGNRVRAIGLAAGLVDNKVCAISAVWSGLRFVMRRERREA